MNKNLFQLWKDAGERLPFAATRTIWAKGTYVLVEQVTIRRWPYGTAHGHFYRNGSRVLDRVIGDELPEIDNAGVYSWAFVDVPGITRGKPKPSEKPTRVLRAGDKIGFGTHAQQSIDEVFAENPGWVKWALINVAHIAIDPDLISRFNSTDPETRIGKKLQAVNAERIDKVESPDDDSGNVI